jgi:uncharacterized protein
MRRLSVDTFCLIALSNPRDQWHQRVMAFSQTLTTVRLYTVEEVLAEFLTFCSTAGAQVRTDAAHAVRHALHDTQWTVFPQSHTSFLDALTLYESRPDKEYSLTDCIAMHVMRSEGITEVLTNDHHFTQEGFQILFR